jgi:hypothetical protein
MSNDHVTRELGKRGMFQLFQNRLIVSSADTPQRFQARYGHGGSVPIQVEPSKRLTGKRFAARIFAADLIIVLDASGAASVARRHRLRHSRALRWSRAGLFLYLAGQSPWHRSCVHIGRGFTEGQSGSPP